MNPLDSIEGAIAASGNRKNVLVVQASAYRGFPLLGVRRWYIDRKTGEWKPTKKGISLSKAGFEFLKSVFESEQSRINRWFESSTEEIRAAESGDTLASFDRLESDFSLVVKTDLWNGPEIGRFSAEGAIQTLTINRKHEIGRKLLRLKEEIDSDGGTPRETSLMSLLLYFIASLERMPLMFEGRQSWQAEEFFDAIRWNLGILVRSFEKCGEIDYVI